MNTFIRCSKCCMPNTKPDIYFMDGVCSACLSYAKREQIDWRSRSDALLQLIEQHGGRVIVPSSGGKDSSYIALRMKELGADVTAVTATTCHLTKIGRENLDNLARHVRTIEVTPNMMVRAKLNRIALQTVGDISWPEHASIFSVPFRVARDIGVTLIMYGENPQAEYGGPKGSDETREMTRRWTSEFGGFLGMRPSDFVGLEGITARDMEDYKFPVLHEHDRIEAHFLGVYEPWDSHRNADVAKKAGMKFIRPCPANYWEAENQDNAQTGLHDYAMFLKYGYGRGCAQISVDLRSGRITDRGSALAWVKEHDGLFPHTYAGVSASEVFERIGLDGVDTMAIFNKFANWEVVDASGARHPRDAMRRAKTGERPALHQ